MPKRVPFAEPDPAGSERARIAKATRDLATEVSRLRPQALTRSNGEEADHGGIGRIDDRDVDHHYHHHKSKADELNKDDDKDNNRYPANFTKGLAHDEFGLLGNPWHYQQFVEAVTPSRCTTGGCGT